MEFTILTLTYAIIYGVRQLWEIILNRLDYRLIKSKRNEIPDHLTGKMELATYQRSIDYNLENSQFGLVSRFFSFPVHWGFILFGFGWIDQWLRGYIQNTYLQGLVFIGIYSFVSILLDLPFTLYHDFVIEARYGFNKKTVSLFITDAIKALLLGILLGIPLLLLIFYLMDVTGWSWWLWTFIGVSAFQFLIMWIFPILIAPLFNKFKPLDGALADDIYALAHRAGFKTSGVFTMDGSLRSTHSNAFFTGIGQFKRIVFFDTLLEKVTPQQLLGVLAHEIGHFRLGHVRKNLIFVLIHTFLFLGLLALLKEQTILYHSFGFSEKSDYAALIVFSILFSEFTFPFRYMINYLSRSNEFAADRFVYNVLGTTEPLVEALQILHTDNLASPIVHPWYAAYHYSHPDLPERIAALRNIDQGDGRISFPGSNSSQKCHNPGSALT